MILTDGIGFHSRQVTQLTGISYRQLDYWTSTKLIAPSIANEKGSGNFRQFSNRDVLQILIIQELLANGFDVSRLRKISCRIRKVLKDTKHGDYLLIQNKWVQCLNSMEVFAHLSNFGDVISIVPLDKLKEKIWKGVEGDQ